MGSQPLKSPTRETYLALGIQSLNFHPPLQWCKPKSLKIAERSCKVPWATNRDRDLLTFTLCDDGPTPPDPQTPPPSNPLEETPNWINQSNILKITLPPRHLTPTAVPLAPGFRTRRPASFPKRPKPALRAPSAPSCAPDNQNNHLPRRTGQLGFWDSCFSKRRGA